MHLDTAFIAFYDRAGGANIDASTLLETFLWVLLYVTDDAKLNEYVSKSLVKYVERNGRQFSRQ